MPDGELPEPWSSFLTELDNRVSASKQFPAEPIELHCFGGFVISVLYSLTRTTNDLDVLTVVPFTTLQSLLTLAGRDSELARKHGVYLDAQGRVGILPEAYQERLEEIFSGMFSRLRLFALEVHDLVLSKLEANRDRDRDDVSMLAMAGLLDVSTLRQRYETELRPYLLAGTEKRHDRTRDLWIEMIEEIRRSPSTQP